MLKPFPNFASDEEAEDFVANADLTEYDWASLRPVKLLFSPETGVSGHDIAVAPVTEAAASDGKSATGRIEDRLLSAGDEAADKGGQLAALSVDD